MCRLAWQLLSMLGNILGHPRHVLQRPKHAWQRPRSPQHAFSQGPRSPISKNPPPHTCCLISCEVKGVVYHQTLYETWWYTTPLASQLIRQQVREFFFDVGLLGPCEKGMPRTSRTLPSMPRTL